MKYEVKLSVKALIRAEQFLSKPFAEINYTDPDDLIRLLYCIVLVSSNEAITFDDFLELAENQKFFTGLVGKLEKYYKVLDQFTGSASRKDESPAERPLSVKETAGLLVMSGLSPGYVMNELDLADIPVFLEAIDRKKREDMEAARLWTFLSAAPHINTRQIKKAEDYFPFPWEMEKEKKEAEETILRDEAIAEQFFKEGKNIFKN